MSRISATATGGPVTGSPAYPLGSSVNAEGHVVVGGCDLVGVAREFGTPAYVYAPDDIRARARIYLDALQARGVEFGGSLREQGRPASRPSTGSAGRRG